MDLVLPKYDFDFGKPVVGFGNFTGKFSDRLACGVDRSVIARKLELWDGVLVSGVLNDVSDEASVDRARAVLLLKDVAIMAYHYFRFDNVPLRLRWYQDALLSDVGDRILFCASNQIGKSLTLDVDAAVLFLRDHKKNWVGLLVSNSLDQSQFQMDRVKGLLKSAGINYRDEDTVDVKTGKRDNKTSVSYTFYGDDGVIPLYSNLLICCPHTSSALGYPADVVWLDEFDFWDDVKGGQRHFLYQVVIPRTIETGGKIKIFSNPNGRGKLLYELWNQVGDDGGRLWHCYNFNFWDKPGAGQEQFDKFSKGMTFGQIDSTLLARFARGEGAFFSWEEIQDSVDVGLNDSSGLGRETVWFLDVGSVHDQSVLVGGFVEENASLPDIPSVKIFWVHKFPVGYPLGRVIGVSVDEKDGWEDSVEGNFSVLKVLDIFSDVFGGKKLFPLMGYDATSNAGIGALFQSVGVEPVGVVFTGRRKWEMYQRFQYYVQQRFLKRALDRDENAVRNSDCSYQMSKLVIKKDTRTAYHQIHHESEGDLDDCTDAIAGLIHLVENPDCPSLSFDVINSLGVNDGSLSGTRDGAGQGGIPLTDLTSGQYIPDFVNRDELRSWVEDKVKGRR